MAPSDGTHLREHELAGFLDGDLAPEERARVVSHLDECAACRRELVEMQQVVDSYSVPNGEQRAHQAAAAAPVPPPAKRWRIAGLGSLAAAAVIAAVLVTGRSAGNDATTARTRDATIRAADEGRRPITVLAPPETATVSARSTVFSWQSTGADLYRFTLLSQSGEPIWTHETPDTTLRIPPSIAPTRETPYFWRVDAIADGIAATSGARVVRLSP